MLRINSVVTSGFGKETGLISFLYSYFLNFYGLDFYPIIVVNHIGLDLEEKIFYGEEITHINIRFDIGADIRPKSHREKNEIFIQIIHQALLRLAREDPRMDAAKLEAIRELILTKDFEFDIEYITTPNEADKFLVGKIILRPHMEQFDFVAQILYQEKIKWQALIYEGGPSSYYFDDILSYGKWNGVKEFIFGGNRSEIQFHFDVNEGKIILINNNENKAIAPIFNLFRVNAGSHEMQDYLNSLPPAMAGIIAFKPN